jgi:hypothetical protein
MFPFHKYEYTNEGEGVSGMHVIVAAWVQSQANPYLTFGGRCGIGASCNL